MAEKIHIFHALLGKNVLQIKNVHPSVEKHSA